MSDRQRLDRALLHRSLAAPAPPSEPAARTPTGGAGDPACRTCRGAGWLVAAVPVGHPAFGTLQPCACLEQIRRRQQQVQADARQPAIMADLQPRLDADQGTLGVATFAAFRLDRPLASSVTWCGQTFDQAAQQAALWRAWTAMQRYVDEPGWSLLLGPPGSGKSHLAGAVAHALRARGVPLLVATSEAVLRCLRQGMADRSSDDRLEALQAVAVLILDDLGVEHRTPWACEKLYALLHTRAETGRATLITANLPLDLLTPVTTGEAGGVEPAMRWARLVSRIAGRCGLPLILAVSDIRRQQEWSIDQR